MAQSVETLIHSDSRCCPNSSFDTDFESKSRTASSSSSGMDSSEDVIMGGHDKATNSSTTRSTQSSTSSYSSCTDVGEEVWNNFIFKPVQPEDYPKLLEHMRESFYRDEPLNATMGYSEAKAIDMDVMITEYFKEGLSSIVLEKDTNKVAGARIIVIHRRHPTHSPTELKSMEMKKIMNFLDTLDEKAAIFNHYPELDEYAELFMASVHTDFRGQGLAGEMYRGAIRLVQGKGLKLMKSCFTSPFTRIIGKKMGFRELAQAWFREHRDQDGQLTFPNSKPDEVAVIAVLEI